MISKLLDEFLIDFAILGLSYFSYLLHPYARRLLAAGRLKLRLRLLWGWLSLWGTWALPVVGFWTRLSRWRLSGAQLRLLELGLEIEHFNWTARNSDEDDDSRELRLEPGLVSEVVQVCASSRFPPGTSMQLAQDNPSGQRLGLEFVSRDDPVVCSLNWIDVDLICFELSARVGHAGDGCGLGGGGGAKLSRKTDAVSEQVRPRSGDVHSAGDHGEGDDCDDRVGGRQDPIGRPSSKSFSRTNDGKLTISNTTNADMRAPNEALNNSGGVLVGESPHAERPATRGTEWPPADTKAGPNEDETTDAADGDGPRRRRQPAAVVHVGESHLSVSHEDQLVHARGVWGDENRVLIMLQQQQQQQHRQHALERCDPSRRDMSKRQGIAFCLVKFYTSPELLVHNRRAALIFYLIQLHSRRLVQLFGLVSVVLERAGLLGASGFCCRGSWPGFGEEGGTSARDSEQAVDDWLELIGWELDQDEQSGRQQMRPRRTTTFMDRYALLLMMAAYLDRERAGGRARSRGTSGGQIGLASSLMGFLECFSSSSSEPGDGNEDGANDRHDGRQDKRAKMSLVVVRSGRSKATAPSREDIRMEIEFVPLAKHGPDKATDERAEIGLIVLDPVRLGLDEASNTYREATASDVDELTDSEANLTAGLTVWPQIRQLFADCLQHLRLSTAVERATMTRMTGGTNAEPILAGLVELARRSRLERRRQLPDLSAQIGGLWRDSPKSRTTADDKNQLQCLRDSGKQTSSDGGKFARANTATSTGSQDQSPAGQTAGWRLRLKAALRHAQPNKLGRSVFFLMVFVAIRLAIMHYLAGLQRDLMYEARDDFIALKRMVFPEGLHGLTEDEEEEDAGDGISILTRDERRQRAEREARRRQQQRLPPEPRPSDTSQRARGNEANDVARNENDNGHNRDQRAPNQPDAANPAGDVNQVMEALLASLMSQALGGGGGLNPADFSKMDPRQLQEMMRMLEGFELGGGDDEDEDEGDLDYEDIEEAEPAKIMDRMQLNDGFGADLAGANLDELMADGRPGDLAANIDPGATDDDDDDENNDSSTDHKHGGDLGDHKEDPNWPQSHVESTQESGASTTTAGDEL